MITCSFLSLRKTSPVHVSSFSHLVHQGAEHARVHRHALAEGFRHRLDGDVIVRGPHTPRSDDNVEHLALTPHLAVRCIEGWVCYGRNRCNKMQKFIVTGIIKTIDSRDVYGFYQIHATV